MLRTSREVEGRLLSAADLARLLGTSKARVLAYESGTSVPEPGRILMMAQLFGVPPRELHQPTRGQNQLSDLRSYAGFTAAELARHVGISRTTYRNIENQALLPARDDGTLPLRLAEALGIPLAMVHRALDNHPMAARRRKSIARHLDGIFRRAHLRFRPAVVDPDDPALLEITKLLRRPAGVVCRLVNHELGIYRSLLQRRDVFGVNAAYAQNKRSSDEAARAAAHLENTIEFRHSAAAGRLVRFLAEAMTAQQWRTMVTLLTHNSVWVPFDEEAHVIWGGLTARDFVFMERSTPEAVKMSLTRIGWQSCRDQAAQYACLYPRIGGARIALNRPPTGTHPASRNQVPGDGR
ncbi:helix-turn-helix domain-containing protein [Streptomyces albipurpureus]|uniref:Helix-turn-helix domain-containing protein n=1 Tax=Streptomyces albipurpureus TaxID=2897419 RepID=A0ABT0UM40_9ACTN|nr:helix-turn-helix transcriptional regulator [Streptomyces sp. CWNU-1]MCM2388331.1 helix-turn-helix domain-containing protein [Streptomyces sp. CWNU-1]